MWVFYVRGILCRQASNRQQIKSKPAIYLSTGSQKKLETKEQREDDIIEALPSLIFI